MRRHKDAFLKKLNGGEINTRLCTKHGVDKHDQNTREFREYATERERAKLTPPSYFLDDPKKLYPEVLKKLTAPETVTRCIGSPPRILQTITFDRPVGYTYNADGTKVQTDHVTVVFSQKDGIHYYPDHAQGRGSKK